LIVWNCEYKEERGADEFLRKSKNKLNLKVIKNKNEKQEWKTRKKNKNNKDKEQEWSTRMKTKNEDQE